MGGKFTKIPLYQACKKSLKNSAHDSNYVSENQILSFICECPGALCVTKKGVVRQRSFTINPSHTLTIEKQTLGRQNFTNANTSKPAGFFFQGKFSPLGNKKNPVQLIQRIFVKKCTKSCHILRKKFPKSLQLHNMHSFSHAQIFRCTTTKRRHNSLEQEQHIDNLLFRISAKPSTSLEICTHTTFLA